MPRLQREGYERLSSVKFHMSLAVRLRLTTKHTVNHSLELNLAEMVVLAAEFTHTIVDRPLLRNYRSCGIGPVMLPEFCFRTASWIEAMHTVTFS